VEVVHVLGQGFKGAGVYGRSGVLLFSSHVFKSELKHFEVVSLVDVLLDDHLSGGHIVNSSFGASPGYECSDRRAYYELRTSE